MNWAEGPIEECYCEDQDVSMASSWQAMALTPCRELKNVEVVAMVSVEVRC